MFSLFRFPPIQKLLIIKKKSKAVEPDKWYYVNCPFSLASRPSQDTTEYTRIWYAGRNDPPPCSGRTGATVEPLGMSIYLERFQMAAEASHAGHQPEGGSDV